MNALPITFTLTDSSRGYAISPARVPASVLADFSSEVVEFIKGSGRQDISMVEMSISEGSLSITAANIPLPSFFQDLEVIKATGDLSRVDSKRREVMEKWQARAKQAKSVALRIINADRSIQLIVNSTSSFQSQHAARLVDVERYIRGEVQDLGGVVNANIHVLTSDGEKLVVRTTRELLRSETKNRVYQDAYMRVRGKLNLDTNELVDVELVSFVEYAPKFDEKDMANLVSEGRKAWGDVGDPAEWIRNLRGGQ